MEPFYSRLGGIFIVAVTKFTVRIEFFLYEAVQLLSKSPSTKVCLHFFIFHVHLKCLGCWEENIIAFPNTSDAESTAQWQAEPFRGHPANATFRCFFLLVFFDRSVKRRRCKTSPWFMSLQPFQLFSPLFFCVFSVIDIQAKTQQNFLPCTVKEKKRNEEEGAAGHMITKRKRVAFILFNLRQFIKNKSFFVWKKL